MVSVGIDKPGVGKMEVFRRSDLVSSMTSALNIVLAYSGHVTYFGFASELKNPRDFTKSLIMLQTTAIFVYTFVALFIYYYVGPEVPAPALSAGREHFRMAGYGVASVTIVIAGVVNGSVGAKQIYLRLWQWRKQPEVVQAKTAKSIFSWVAIVVSFWVLAWVIAESIPSFEHVLALVAALLSGWYSCKFSVALEQLMRQHTNRFCDDSRYHEFSLVPHEQGSTVVQCTENLPHDPECGHLGHRVHYRKSTIAHTYYATLSRSCCFSLA